MEKSDGNCGEVNENIEFVRGFLFLLKETDLFGPMIEKALQSVEFLNEEIEHLSHLSHS